MDEHALFAGPGEDEADLFGQNLEDEMMEEEEGEDMDEDMEDMDEEPAREGRGWGAGGAGARGLREAGPSAPEVAEEEVMDVRAILEETERRPGNTALHLLSHMRLASAVSDSEEEEEAEDEDLQPGPSRQASGAGEAAAAALACVRTSRAYWIKLPCCVIPAAQGQAGGAAVRSRRRRHLGQRHGAAHWAGGRQEAATGEPRSQSLSPVPAAGK